MANTKIKDAKSIFIANVKGGVGKSTLSIMLARALAEKIPPQNITVIDTDLQRTATEFLTRYNSNYIAKRVSAYPSIEDQLDKIYHEGIDAWKSEIKAIKDANPK